MDGLRRDIDTLTWEGYLCINRPDQHGGIGKENDELRIMNGRKKKDIEAIVKSAQKVHS